MNRFLSLASFSILALSLFSCEKEYIEPTLETTTQAEARTASCDQYFYFHKVYGKVNYGKAAGEVVLVGFQEGLSLEARQKVLSKYSQFQSIDGEVALDSGIITEVKLVPGATCFDAEKLISKLLKEKTVSFAYPVFEKKTADPEEPALGLTNEFMVSIEAGTLKHLEKLVAITNTKILFSFSDEVHVITSDKKSTGNVLALCSIFNLQGFVQAAEPNVIYKFPPLELEEIPVAAQSAKIFKKGNFKAVKHRLMQQK
ncbi:hypothetical protein [Rufibacter immobilis]|uniref:hypothetical protein n=1 Tax=Rufibacter immobilis TaxID=1348778 RepID=UPI0035EFCE62